MEVSSSKIKFFFFIYFRKELAKPENQKNSYLSFIKLLYFLYIIFCLFTENFSHITAKEKNFLYFLL